MSQNEDQAKPVFRPEAITIALMQAMGGWIDLCNTPTEKDLEFRMHEFSKRYQGYVIQGGKMDYPPYLIGKSEAGNAREGYRIDPPLLLGDQQRAQQVFEGGSKPAQRIEKPRAQISSDPAQNIKLIASNAKAES